MLRRALPHNEKTVVDLPRTDGEYTLTFYTQGSRVKQYECTPFKGDKPIGMTFSCDLRGGMHGLKSDRGVLLKGAE